MGEEEKKKTVENKKENEDPKKPEEDKKKTDHVVPISPPPEDNKKPAKEEEDSGGSLPSPPTPQEIILKVYMHCEGCARKVRRCLKGFQGVEDVVTDTKAHTVVVKGEKADPLKVLQRVQDKNHRQVELISPKPPLSDEKEIVNPPPPPQQQPPQKKEAEVITVMLKVHMHCEACAQEIRRRIQKMQGAQVTGVESATTDLKTSEVVVKGSFMPPKLIDFIRKRTGKHALIVKVEPEKQAEEKPAKEENTTTTTTTSEEEKKDTKPGGGSEGEGKDTKKDTDGKEKNDVEGEKQEADGGNPTKVAAVELKKSELLYNYPQYYQQLNHQSLIQHELNAYPPQMFSDENPNSCSVM